MVKVHLVDHHLQECTVPRKGQECYTCGEEGHQSRVSFICDVVGGQN
jgi:hypothetical protein